MEIKANAIHQIKDIAMQVLTPNNQRKLNSSIENLNSPTKITVADVHRDQNGSDKFSSDCTSSSEVSYSAVPNNCTGTIIFLRPALVDPVYNSYREDI